VRLFYTLIFVFVSIFSVAQNAKLHGFILDSISRETLTGVTVVANNKNGTVSNLAGEYKLNLAPGTYTIQFSYTGYLTHTETITVVANDDLGLSILLQAKTKELHIVTISGSRFEKRVAEETVSIEVIKPAQILNSGVNEMDDALNRVAGVDVIDNQINIRGGSGWSYGAGSRVLVLVDDMPMLTADAADAKWDFLPIENCEQVEILKGASSSLYGSSALNGVVNFRTGFAKNKPKTKVMLYNAMYGNPKEKSWVWWDRQQPGFQGGYFSHAQKFGQLDLVLGSAWFSEDSYLQGDLNRRIRGNMNLRYRSKKVEGLILGMNVNAQTNKSQTFFFWQPDTAHHTTLYYQPFGGLEDTSTTVNKNRGLRMNIDPYITYYTKGGSRHALRTRWFRSGNDIPEKNQSSKADTYYGEYQFQKSIISQHFLLNQINVVSGITSSYSNIIGELYGNHTVFNAAAYFQMEKKINKLWTSIGARYEMNQVDTYKVETKPVLRAGVNYEAGRATFFRASFGQGYRYPSIAERFVKTSFGATQVFPNPALQSETGWSAELACKQGYKIGSWLGFVDVAGFWMQYKSMMEFNFGFFAPPDSTIGNVANALKYIGFESINVGDTRINGIDISVMGEGKIKNLSARFMGGYTYMNPILLHPDSVILANISGTSRTLKYRYRNSAKLDAEVTYHKVSIGTTLLYNSKMENIDEVFENSKPTENLFGRLFELGTNIPTTVAAFRAKYNKGRCVWDLRVAYQLSKQAKLAFITKNVLNVIYAERPAIVAPPRNFTLQLGVEL